MREQIQISAKDLGQIALTDFCPRCFWIKLRLGSNRLPFQIFPGIFSTIDSYNKRIVHSWFDKHKAPPPWMLGLGDLTDYRRPPHHSEFRLVDPVHNVLLTGSPDGVFLRRDGSYLIVDYKTAKHTGTQDELYPMYEMQLNVYALLGERLGLDPVSGLALIYMDPVTDEEEAANDGNHRKDGFVMGFRANIYKVKLDVSMIPPLLAKAREIYESAGGPPGRPGCRDCQSVEELRALVS